MGQIMLGTYATQSRSQETNLKLEAQKVNKFTGAFEVWSKWKSRTECAFDGSGYELVLTDREFADENPRMNRVVYSQLAAATIDGISHHLIKQHEVNKDGHAAWNALITWYDGNTIKNEIAESLRNKLEVLKLHQGTSASQYINQFLTWYHNLERIEGESYSPGHIVYLFLQNITDPDYHGTIVFLRNNDANLDDAVKSIRKAERDLMQKRVEARKQKSYVRRYSNDNAAKEKRENTGGHKRELKSLPTNERGMISLQYQE